LSGVQVPAPAPTFPYGDKDKDEKVDKAEGKRQKAGSASALCLLPFAFCLLPSAFCLDMSLCSRALETIRRHGLVRPGGRVLVALSGGADSVALLLLLRELEQDGVLTVAGAAHLNHQLRGAESDGDEAFCAGLAARMAVPFRAERTDISTLARAQKRSVEDAARSARYDFFERMAVELSADVVAVAHSREDQAETFLLRLLRGSGTRGLASIQPRAGRVVRPLLDVPRADLRAYLAASGQVFREDSSNADVTIPRNRVRHQLIPSLQLHFSTRITDVLAREAALARQDEEFLHSEAIKLAARIVLTNEPVRIDVAGLRSAPRALSSRVVQAALQRLAGSRTITFDHVERVLALAGGAGEGGAVSLPGQYAVRAGGSIVLRPGRSRVPAGANSFAFSLSIPGEVELGPQRLAVGAESLPGLRGGSGRQRKWAGRGSEVGVAAASLELPLAVRSRRPGDRFTPLGAPGARKLQDFLVDRKVARDERDSLPLVVDGRDRIVWVVGQSVAEDFRVTDPSQGVLLLKVRRF
jgi:tRNA(Ile)-lysidine synthase